MSYRDGQVVVREMLAGKRADALSRARSLGYAQRAVLDENAVAEVEALHDRTMPFLFDEPSGDDEIRAAIRHVDELVAAYDTLLARSAVLLAPAELPIEQALAPARGWQGTAERVELLERELRAVLHGARLFERRAVGIAVVYDAWALLVGLYGDDETRHVQGQITVAIPSAVPEVHARGEENVDDFKQHLGIAKEIETADARFDDAYWIEGHREAAFAAATPAVRSVLVGLVAHRGALDVGGGLARISWAGAWKDLGSTGVPPGVVTAILELQAAFSQ